ncbi:MAG: ferredoxin [Nanoarchaeota archaeon]|nr:ferredoxin [Nanoarchaeota archaeon]
MKYKIDFDDTDCQGCGACTVCDNWKFNDNGKVKPVNTELTDIGCNKDAADICPVDIIKIIPLDD